MKRTLWMFPRNKRSAGPTEVGLMVRALSNALASSPNSSIKDQEAQDSWIETLNKFDLKVGSDLQHVNSGGARTYFAYLKQLGLMFDSADKKSKSSYLTLAGSDIAELKNPASVIRQQVFRMQFPSPYSIGRQVDIDVSIKVRPAVFVAQMANAVELDGFISNEDVAVAVMYGRTHADLDKVIKKCLKARTAYQQSLRSNNKKRRIEAITSIIDDVDADLYTTKTWINRSRADYIEYRIDDVINIANTLVNRLLSAGILLKDFTETSRFDTGRLYFNKRFLDELQNNLNEPILLPDQYTDEAAWQRRLGRGSSTKDNRTDLKCKKYVLDAPEEILKTQTLKTYQKYGTLFDKKSFCENFSIKTGLSVNRIRDLMESVLPDSRDDLERQLIETGSDPDKHQEFEVNIAHLMKATFPFADVQHVGQRRRVDKSLTSHDFSDVVVHFPSHKVMQIDAKATQKDAGYEYQASEQSKSEAYVKYPLEIYQCPDQDQQVCFTIISPGFTRGAYSNALRSSQRTSIPFVLLPIRELIDEIDECGNDYDKFLNHILAKKPPYNGLSHHQE